MEIAPMPMLRTSLLLLLLTLPGLAMAQFPRTVGPDADCHHATLQSAINAAADGETIHIANTSNYLGQAYSITDKSLTIRGGYADCALGTLPNGRTTLDANNMATVMNIVSSDSSSRTVVLENLRLRRGNGTVAGGLGIIGRPGALQVQVRNVEISNNTSSGSGGGIHLRTNGSRIGARVMLTIDNDSSLLNNSAPNGYGGGLACYSTHEPGSIVLARIGSTLVYGNSAQDGGGMAFDGCRNVRLHNGGPFVFILPSGGIVGNTATGWGGGLHLRNGAEVEMSPGSGSYGNLGRAATIFSNTAAFGGGFNVRGSSQLTLIGTRVETNNVTGNGAGGNVSGTLIMREFLPIACQPASSSGGVTNFPLCSSLRNNRAEHPSFNTHGGALAVTAGSNVSLRNTLIEENFATIGSALNAHQYSAGGDIHMQLEGVQIRANEGGVAFVASSTNGQRVTLDIRFSTIAGNDIPGGAVIRSSATTGSVTETSLRSSIVHQPGKPLVSNLGTGTHIAFGDCLIAAPALASSGLQAALTRGYSSIDPGFIDPAGGNYRLQQNSPAIDYCDDATLPTQNDLDGKLRGQTWTGPTPIAAPGRIPGAASRYDLGAFEAQLQDGSEIFKDGFE